MLNQTKHTIEDLLDCEIQRKHFSVNTPIDFKYKGWKNPKIFIKEYTNKYIKFYYVKKLLNYFNILITVKNGKPSHMIVYYNYSKKGNLCFYNHDTNKFYGNNNFLHDTY